MRPVGAPGVFGTVGGAVGAVGGGACVCAPIGAAGGDGEPDCDGHRHGTSTIAITATSTRGHIASSLTY
jgi:hypothetical protein